MAECLFSTDLHGRRDRYRKLFEMVDSDWLGLNLDIPETETVGADKRGWIPARIHLADYPELKRLAWHVGGTEVLSAREAMDIYEGNRRHLDLDSMIPEELQLLDDLRTAFGLPEKTT